MAIIFTGCVLVEFNNGPVQCGLTPLEGGEGSDNVAHVAKVLGTVDHGDARLAEH